MPSDPTASPSYEFKSAFLSVVAFLLRTTDTAALTAELNAQLAADPEFFDNDAVLLDLSQVSNSDAPIDFPVLVALLREHGTLPVAARGGNPQQMAAALAAGLAPAPDEIPVRTAAAAAPAEPAPPRQPATPAAAAEALPAAAPTLVIHRPLRSGQQVYARGADLIVLDVVSFGAEVIADGNIHVYAPLRGRAIAGARGNTEARIFSTCMEPQLLSIAGIYRTTETALPDEVVGKPAQARLDGEKMLIDPL